jgi:hypothetical protein
MAAWGPTVADKLRSDIRFALVFKVGRRRRPLTDVERDMVAHGIVEHLKLCNWRIEHGPPAGGHFYRPPAKDGE